jgi:hypothetical protein
VRGAVARRVGVVRTRSGLRSSALPTPAPRLAPACRRLAAPAFAVLAVAGGRKPSALRLGLKTAHLVGVVLAIAVLCFFSFTRFRPGQQLANLLIGYGPLPAVAAYWIRFVLCACMFGLLLTWLSHHGTDKFTYRSLWAVYWLIAVWSHVFTWDSVVAPAAWTSVAFHAFAAMHVALEFVLCVLAVVPRSEAAWYNDRLVAYTFTAAFFDGFFQQKTLATLVAVGGMLAVPADTFTIVAGYCIYQRATDWDAKLMGIAWALNGIDVIWLLGTLSFGSLQPDNLSGLPMLGLIADYVFLMYTVHRNIMMRDLSEDELEKELRRRGVLPRDPAAGDDFDEPNVEGGLMQTKAGAPHAKAGPTPREAFIMFFALCGGVGLFLVVPPLLLGKLDITTLVE